MVKRKELEEALQGWPAIAKFLSQPVSTAQRWASEGMPVTRTGRYVAASPAELERWLTREAGTKETVHISCSNTAEPPVFRHNPDRTFGCYIVRTHPFHDLATCSMLYSLENKTE
jgi:hypothetical protein